MKYIGSKAKLAKYIIPFMEPYLKQAVAYIEPFCGGCNMIDKVEHYNRIAFDGNPYLIDMWLALQTGWQPPENISKELYTEIKDSRSKGYFTNQFIGFVGHNCSFSGDWFAGYAGTGEDRNRCAEAKRHVLKQIDKLEDVDFRFGDYQDIDIFFGAVKNTVIYCDPPYYEGFKYRGSKFHFHHKQFWDWCRKMSKHNIVFVSDYHAPPDFKLLWKKAGMVNAHQTGKKTITEKLYVIGDIK